MVTMSDHPAYTAVTWTSPMVGGYYYALLEAGVQTFGGAVFVAKDKPDVSDVYVRAVLVSQDDSSQPVFLRLFTERDRVCAKLLCYLQLTLLQITNPVTNITDYGMARIEFDVISLLPQVALGAVTFVQGNESTSYQTDITISTFNAGATSLSDGSVRLEVRFDISRNYILL